MVTNIMCDPLHHLCLLLISLNVLCFPLTTLAHSSSNDANSPFTKDFLSSTEKLMHNQTLVSSSNLFELGFFSPGNLDESYLGIWYKNSPEKTVVWVANRNNPIRNNGSGILRMKEDGNLVLEDQANCVVVWTTNISSHVGNRVVGKLLDTGNLVLYQEHIDISNHENFLWQSLDYPTDTKIIQRDTIHSLVLKCMNHFRRSKELIVVIGCLIACFVLMALGVSVTFFLWRRITQQVSEANSEDQGAQEKTRDFLSIEVESVGSEKFELPLFDFHTIEQATNSFSVANVVGQGGFGVVYKGILAEEELIAVKRLSKNSRQGVEEFRNELMLTARLQHRNLVRLKGCCVDMEEKMLVYEYMENKSLDSILFNSEQSTLLDWKTRYNIILGIVRGLVYLHEDSRFRVIHRDLKAGNILLDKDMVPKISDFGMSRIFGCDQIEANSKRIVGTFGYMPPEYILDGLFSIKSDVFSFGVLLLEIISGKKITRGLCTTNGKINLLAHAWTLLREGRGLDFLDKNAGGLYSELQVLRCIQVGILCIQERAEDRPTMSNVGLMLSSESIALPQPKYPGYCMSRSYGRLSSSMRDNEQCTNNHVTITVLEGR